MKPETAIKRAGSVSALARMLGVTRQAVQSYRKHGISKEAEQKLRELRPAWFPAPKATPDDVAGR